MKPPRTFILATGLVSFQRDGMTKIGLVKTLLKNVIVSKVRNVFLEFYGQKCDNTLTQIVQDEEMEVCNTELPVDRNVQKTPRVSTSKPSYTDALQSSSYSVNQSPRASMGNTRGPFHMKWAPGPSPLLQCPRTEIEVEDI